MTVYTDTAYTTHIEWDGGHTFRVYRYEPALEASVLEDIFYADVADRHEAQDRASNWFFAYTNRR